MASFGSRHGGMFRAALVIAIGFRRRFTRTDRWRRVLVVRYMSADGDMAPNQYPDYRTKETFDRKFILVRGEDTLDRGLERYQASQLAE